MAILSWARGVDGSWQTAVNWSPSVVPGSGDDIFLTAAGSYAVTDALTTAVSSLLTSAGATLDISGSAFTILNGTGAGTNAGTIKVHDGATLDVKPSSFTNIGSVRATAAGMLVLEGSSFANGNGSLTVDATSKLVLSGATVAGGALTNAGLVEVRPGAAATLNGVSAVNGVVAGTLALDGNGFVSRPFVTSSPLSVALTTINPNDVIVLQVVQNGAGIKSITDSAGLTWTLRASTGVGSYTISEYYAIAPGALSGDAIKVAFNGATSYVDLNAFAVSGANVAVPFDTLLPVTAASGMGAISTTSANDLVFASYRFATNQTPQAGWGWTTLNATGGYYLSEYQIASVTQTRLAATASTSDQNGGIIDAIAQKPAVEGSIAVDAGATLILDSSSIAGGGIANAGTLQVAGDNDFEDIAIANNGGTVLIGSAGTMDLDNTSITGGALVNSRTMNVEKDSSLEGVNITNHGLIETTSGMLTIDSGALTNDANVQATGNTTIELNNLQVNNGQGSLGADRAAELDLKNTQVTAGTISNSGTVNVIGQVDLDNVNVVNGLVTNGVLSLDGSAFYSGLPNPTANGNGSALVSLTTTHPNDIVVLLVTVDDAVNANDGDDQWDSYHLAWHYVAQSGTPLHNIYEYYAVAPEVLSGDVIGIATDGTASHVTLNAFAISGANTSSPFDTNPAVPALSMQSTGTVSTDNANDFVFAGYRFATTSTPAAGAGWTPISAAGGRFLSEYQIASSNLTDLTATASASDENGGIVNAVVQATPTPAVLNVNQNSSLSLNGSSVVGGVLNNAGTVHVTGGATATTFSGVSINNLQTATPFGIDGSAFSQRATTSKNAATVTLTTTYSNDVVVLDVVQNDSSVASVSDAAGLAWHQRAVAGTGSNTIYEYYAIASTALSADTVTVNFDGATSYVDLNAFGVSGANTASPFGQVVGAATSATGTAAISTAGASSLIFAGYRFWLNETPGAGAGWTAVNSGAGYYLSEYQRVSTTQSSLRATASTTDQNGGIVDAIVQSPTGSASGGSISIDAGTTVDLASTTINGGAVANSGIVEAISGTSVLNGVSVAGGGAFTVDGGATILLKGDTVTGGALLNVGTVDSANSSSLLANVAITNTSLIEATTAATLTLRGGSLQNSGILLATTAGELVLDRVTAGQLGTVDVDVSAALQLANTGIGPGTVNNAGAIDLIGTNTLTGVNIKNAGMVGDAAPALSLDGTAFASRPSVPTTVIGVSLTTAKANDVIILDVLQNDAAVGSVTDAAGLNWQLRATAGSGNRTILEYYAVAPHALSADEIDVTFAGTASYAALNAFGIAGANTASPFDSGGSATSARSTVSISTTNANDFVFSAYRFAYDDAPGAGFGWSPIASGSSYFLSEYKTTSARQSSLVATASSLDQNGGIVDAVVQAPAISSVLTNDTGAILNLANTTISGGVLDNLGSIYATTGTNTVAGAAVVNSGLIEASGGELTFSGTVENSGALIANGSLLEIDGPTTGSGTATLSGSNAVLEFGSASSQNVIFANGGTGVLKLDAASSFSGTVAGLAQDDAIDLADFDFSNNPIIASVTGNGSAGSFTDITIQDGSLTAKLHLLNQYANQFAVDAHAYSLVSEQTSKPHAGTLFQLAAHA